jgi:hypothetical protein
MPQPTQYDVHVNTPLTNISVAYIQEEKSFVASEVFPNIPVEKQSDLYYKYVRGQWNTDEMQDRAAGAESAGSGYSLDHTPTYFCKVKALHKDIPDQVRANEDTVLSSDRDATLWLTQKSLIKRERDWTGQYFTAGVWTTQASGVTTGATGVIAANTSNTVLYWDNPSSTPIEDIRNSKRQIQLASGGFRANTAVFSRSVFDRLLDHPDLVDRIKYGQTANPQLDPAIVNKRTLAEIFELERIFVMDGVYNSAQEGGTETNTFIGGLNALICYSAPNPGLLTPTAGYTFSWTGMFGMGPMGNRVSTFRMEWLKSDRVELEMAYAFGLVGAEFGAFFSNVTSS